MEQVTSRELPPKAQTFLDAYTKTRTIKGGAEASGVFRQAHYNWLKNIPAYKELYEVAKRDVLDQWRAIYADRTENGLTERMYDAEGNLKHTRIRQSEGLLKAQMVAYRPGLHSGEGQGRQRRDCTQLEERRWMGRKGRSASSAEGSRHHP